MEAVPSRADVNAGVPDHAHLILDGDVALAGFAVLGDRVAAAEAVHGITSAQLSMNAAATGATMASPKPRSRPTRPVAP
jgi:hypothetical protein